MRIEWRGLVTQGDVVGGNELLVLPFAVVQQAIGEAQGVGGVQGDAAGAVGVGHREAVAVQTVTPGAPPHRLGETHADVILQFHLRDMPQDDRGDMRLGG